MAITIRLQQIPAEVYYSRKRAANAISEPALN